MEGGQKNNENDDNKSDDGANRQESIAKEQSTKSTQHESETKKKARIAPLATKPGAVAVSDESSGGTAASANLSNFERDVIAKTRARGTTARASTPGA
eukprot:12108629-Ditylum_brightwellii.AAC.1